MLKSSDAAKPLSSICLIPLWLAALKRHGSLRTREGEKDESDPPKNGGAMRPKVEACCDIASTRPHGVALVLIYPCGKAWKNPLWRIGPSPSRVRFAASRPGLLRADPRG